MSRNTESEPLITPELLATATVADADGWARLGPEWQALAEQCATATVFQTWEWNAAWWRHYGRRAGRRLRILTWRLGGRLVGLAPLMTGFWYATPLRRLSFIGTGASDYLDILAAPGYEQPVADAFHAELRRTRGWQVADFQQLREGGLLRRFPSHGQAGLTVLDAEGEACPYLPLPADWETLTRQFGKKTRANVGYYDRALRKVYEVDVGYVTRPEDLDAEMDRLFELHQRRWNQRWLPGVFGSRTVRAFHRDAARALLDTNRLRLFLLKLDGQTQACLYCFAFGDRVSYYQGGFEPTLAKWSLGTVLTAHALKSAIGEARAVFDFLRGDEPYKAKWTQATAVNRRRLITRPGPLACLVQRVQRWEDAVERRAKTWARGRK